MSQDYNVSFFTALSQSTHASIRKTTFKDHASEAICMDNMGEL